MWEVRIIVRDDKGNSSEVKTPFDPRMFAETSRLTAKAVQQKNFFLRLNNNVLNAMYKLQPESTHIGKKT
jgi:hypothetical protein